MATLVLEAPLTKIGAAARKFLSKPKQLLIDGKWINACSGKTFHVFDPATGDTIDLARTRAGTRPFFVSTLSGIVTAPTWSAQRSYLAYEGEVVFNQLQRTSPVGTRMRLEIRNVRAREVRQYTNGRCENVPNGGRMFIRRLLLDLPVNNIHTNQDCIDWTGG